MKRCLLCLLTLPLLWSAAPAAQRVNPSVMVDGKYVLALSTVDHFLSAWQERRQDDARALLTRELTGRYSADDLASMLSGLSSPHHEAFEVGSGKPLSATRFAFDVIYYEYYTGMTSHTPRPTPSTIVVVEAKPGTWLIDKLP